MGEDDWSLYAHPLFTAQLTRLIAAVERERAKNPDGFTATANFKLLTSIRKLMFETIPSNPARPEYRQGATLGPEHKNWFRAKFGGGRFRLFFRFDSRARVIVYAWVNDETTLRTYGSKTDAYAVFSSMLAKGNPPNDWAELLAASGTAEEIEKG